MTERTITAQTARRLAIARQHLAGPRAAAHPDGIMTVTRDLGCLQLDPISVVARSHLLVLWSRLGAYDVAELDRLLWNERRLFEYWAHVASVVLTEDFPIHAYLMRRYGTGHLTRHRRLRAWLQANETLKRRILQEVRRRGPIRSRDLLGENAVDWVSTGWTGGRNVTQMLDYLWTKGRIAVAGRQGLEKLWDLAERWFPAWTPRERLSESKVTERAAQRSLRALGVATKKHISGHFTVGRYPGLDGVLARLERGGEVVLARVLEDGTALPGRWFVHAEDLDLVDRIERGDWEPRTALLSPFDNLIRDRERTAMLFGFDFRMEIYVPTRMRRYGYYVMPVLDGDRLVGRVDPAMDRSSGTLRVQAIHFEPGAREAALATRIRGAIEDLGTFLGADLLVLPDIGG